jgi:VIT1/CCC1 family predicted Fe2+/Mn2+ transporter
MNYLNKYLSEVVYGGVDGLITTFAIIAGSSGAHFNKKVTIVLGISSILADGFSMGISSYLAEKIRTVGGKSPISVGITTFLSFIFIGMLPLIPFILMKNYYKKITNQKEEETQEEQLQKETQEETNPIFYSSIIMATLLFLLGLTRGLKQAFETLAIGGATAGISYYVAQKMSTFD